MGRLYAEKIARMSDEGLELTAVADRNRSRARDLALPYGAIGCCDPERAFEEADAVVVATPATSHCDVALAAMRAGLDTLVEKPIASSMVAAQAMVSAAEELGRCLYVGHQEWWNPAVQAAVDLVDAPTYFAGRRFCGFSGRNTDVDVVVDLMIHDVHIVQSVLREEPCSIEAIGARLLSDSTDEACARLVFPAGQIAMLSASRICPTPERRLWMHEHGATLCVDTLASTVTWGPAPFGSAPDKESMPSRQQPQIIEQDDLVSQLRRFLKLRKTRETSPASISALCALRTCLRISNALARKTNFNGDDIDRTPIQCD
ncbi:4-carboxy-2-hydroxymuconate-6-semialdehyde dehydrogenase [Pseudobythopirellula maris]|uniref:4-carboxy-2-hydroxymuconate-6-semialdehyde dehydrogenase n=2 Tax=Pseudobythopirellula maris TaxID=2527991 RepID=A0A5C5ZRV9_9BACT|nr:4-carboxy-2-hydroxymuconate-6-semialdehyde dehydrogenase [Pseudobythopirellula maris]